MYQKKNGQIFKEMDMINVLVNNKKKNSVMELLIKHNCQ